MESKWYNSINIIWCRLWSYLLQIMKIVYIFLFPGSEIARSMINRLGWKGCPEQFLDRSCLFRFVKLLYSLVWEFHRFKASNFWDCLLLYLPELILCFCFTFIQLWFLFMKSISQIVKLIFFCYSVVVALKRKESLMI